MHRVYCVKNYFVRMLFLLQYIKIGKINARYKIPNSILWYIRNGVMILILLKSYIKLKYLYYGRKY